jgi:inorganic pyrophosphatase
MGTDSAYWRAMIELIASTPVVLDRPRGTTHPRYADLIYPLDYGYLEKISAGDGDGIDVWIGSSEEKTLTGILCTFDKLKRDAEIKLLIGCSKEDVETIQGFNNDLPTLFIPNPMVENDLSD